MTPASKQLVAQIASEIKRDGPIPFARFMELALYTPKLGYYTGGRTKIGKDGDFYTSLDVHPVFGQLIAAQIVEMSALLPDGPYTVVEMGAGKGLLAYDILRTVRAADRALFDRLVYRIVDISPDLISRQKKLLAEFADKTCWHTDLDGMDPVDGVFVSNELVDSLPHHQVVTEKGALREVFVDCRDGRLVEHIGDLSTDAISRYFERYKVTFPDRYRTEVNLAAGSWITAVSERLNRGHVLTIDYGYPADVYYRPDRKTGTFLCYHEHKVSENPYVRVGLQDLTAHVDFSGLADAGKKAGLTPVAFTDQAHFLVGLGITRMMDQVLARDGGDPEKSDEFCAMRKLMDPNGMGRAFKVLLQEKNVISAALSGFRFAAHSISDIDG